MTDMMGRITDLNEAALRLYGYGVVTIYWAAALADLGDEVRPRRMAESTNQSLVSGRGQTTEYTMVCQDGIDVRC